MEKSSAFIGLRGKIGTGKDTVAEYLVEKHGFIRIGFSDAVKKACAAMFDQDLRDFHNSFEKERYIPFWDMTRREMLQKMGTDIIRDHFDPNHWIKVAKYQVVKNWVPNKPERYVFSDTRFQNEIDYILQEKGIIVEVLRQTNPLLHLVKNKEHASEIQVLEIPIDKSFQITNNSTKENLYVLVNQLLKNLYLD